jgi:hypothetical protein
MVAKWRATADEDGHYSFAIPSPWRVSFLTRRQPRWCATQRWNLGSSPDRLIRAGLLFRKGVAAAFDLDTQELSTAR